MVGAPLVNVETAKNKAYGAAAIGMPPDEFYAAIEGGGAGVASFETRPGLALNAGGLPVLAEGGVTGGVGVAGALTGAEDWRIAEKALGGPASHSHHRNEQVCVSAAAVAP
jgi:glc operon protein GlcG